MMVGGGPGASGMCQSATTSCPALEYEINSFVWRFRRTPAMRFHVRFVIAAGSGRSCNFAGEFIVVSITVVAIVICRFRF